MRAILAAGLVAGLVGLAGTGRADDKKADPTGTWKWETEFNGQKRLPSHICAYSCTFPIYAFALSSAPRPCHPPM